MRIRKALQDAVHFANWCKRHELEPLDVAELITLADRRKNAYNVPDGDAKFDKATEAVEKKANEMMLFVTWSGLYPTLTKVNSRLVRQGESFMLPDV